MLPEPHRCCIKRKWCGRHHIAKSNVYIVLLIYQRDFDFYDQLNINLCSEFYKSLFRDIVYLLSASRSYYEFYINSATKANPISRHCWGCGGGCCCYRLYR